MPGFFRNSRTWVVDFRYDGHPRRWFKVFDAGVDVQVRMAAELHDLHGDRARLVEVRPASDAEEAQYLRGEAAPNVLCPTGRHGRIDAEPPTLPTPSPTSSPTPSPMQPPMQPPKAPPKPRA